MNVPEHATRTAQTRASARNILDRPQFRGWVRKHAAGDSPGVGSDLDKTGAEYAQAAGVSPWLCGTAAKIAQVAGRIGNGHVDQPANSRVIWLP
ncbi:hypothetical protein GCM10007856_40120 [Azospirillum oryzae]|nr:hypothetical protein GCM10007856_40120 [Azospirillum oryzae]